MFINNMYCSVYVLTLRLLWEKELQMLIIRHIFSALEFPFLLIYVFLCKKLYNPFLPELYNPFLPELYNPFHPELWQSLSPRVENFRIVDIEINPWSSLLLISRLINS